MREGFTIITFTHVGNAAVHRAVRRGTDETETTLFALVSEMSQSQALGASRLAGFADVVPRQGRSLFDWIGDFNQFIS